MTPEKIIRRLEGKLQAEIIRIEGQEAIGIKPFWNFQLCTFYYGCPKRVEPEEGKRRTECLYNPRMFKCPEYQRLFESEFEQTQTL